MRGQSWSKTDVGLIRANNEDAIWADDGAGVYVVADGLGGHAAGDLASRITVQSISGAAVQLRELANKADRQGDEASRRAVFDKLQAVVEHANNEVFNSARADEDLRGMMSTVSVAVLARSAAYVAHVGDSRIYLVRDNHMDLVTVDHTLAEELIRAGRMTREELPTFRYKNVVARAIGEKATVQVDLLYVDLRTDDKILLCSDGLTDFVVESEILRTLRRYPAKPAKALIQTANDHGGGDNVSAIVVRVEETSEETAATITTVVPLETTQKVTLLGQLFFCQHLNDSERMKVLRYIHEEIVPAGATIVTQGEQGYDFFLLVAGTANVTIDGVLVNQLTAGEHFGEIALVSGQHRSASVVATEETRLFRMSRSGFYDLSQKDQAISVKMLWAFSQQLAQRVTELSHELVEAKQR
ncbi:MAG: cyclic nucleotide-binding domain-containing protein [Myxococcales bacterium]|nr:cyclic nucleotide-binding domain-containing protein [Myxococcales bacterium]